MAKTGLLSPLQAGRETNPGRLCDGGGLYLQIKPTGAKSWLFRYKVEGKTRWLGLGGFPDVSLAAARQKAASLRGMRAADVDPHQAREAERQRQKLEAAQTMTFRDAAEAFIASRQSGWKTPKQAHYWRQTLQTYAHPHIGDLPVGGLSVRHVLNVLQQNVAAVTDAGGREVRASGTFWTSRPETARRVRARIEAILDWARVNEYRQGDNPARWEGNLDYALKGGITRRHHPALPFADLPAFLKLLRSQEGIAAAALEFLILTAGRTGEVLGARWDEMDEAAAVWKVPADRMKMKKEHRVPLSSSALAVLARMRCLSRGAYVFPGFRPAINADGASKRFELKPLSNMALLVLLRRMGRSDITPHGMRSTFRDWCAEETDFPSEVAEMALAHAVPDAVEKAYRRGDLFKKRCALMQAWANYCNGATADKVVQLGGRAA